MFLNVYLAQIYPFFIYKQTKNKKNGSLQRVVPTQKKETVIT